MNFTSGAMIYQEIKSIDGHLKDYLEHIHNIPINSATRRLVDLEIERRTKQFDQCGKELYVLKSDYEKRQLELYNQINELKHLLKQNISQEEFDHHFPTEPPF